MINGHILIQIRFCFQMNLCKIYEKKSWVSYVWGFHIGDQDLYYLSGTFKFRYIEKITLILKQYHDIFHKWKIKWTSMITYQQIRSYNHIKLNENQSDLYNWRTGFLEKVRFVPELFQYIKVKYIHLIRMYKVLEWQLTHWSF